MLSQKGFGQNLEWIGLFLPFKCLAQSPLKDIHFSICKQGLHDHPANVEQINGLIPDDAGFVRSAHSIQKMIDTENSPLQVDKLAIEPKR